MRLIGVYSQTSGSFLAIRDYRVCEPMDGYSGNGAGLNNTLFEHKRNLGPIPRGRYLVGTPHQHAKLGPVVMSLFPHNHSAQGRDGFAIHGDNGRGDKSASKGCIVLAREDREFIAETVRLAEKAEELPYIIVLR